MDVGAVLAGSHARPTCSAREIPTVSTLRLATFGHCELRRERPGGGWDTIPVAGKPMGLLVRMASAAPGEVLSRDVIASELWSEIERERAQAQLRTALWVLRKHLPPEAIRADDSTISLVQAPAYDRAEFQLAIRGMDYAAAILLYRGDFLAHFAVSGARGFEEWVELERRNLRGLFVGAAAAEAQRLIRGARFGDAAALARRARDAEPLNQSVWRALLQALISAGDSVSLRNEAAAFLALQREERFAIEPESAQLLKLASATVPVAVSGGAPPELEAELVGREVDLSGLIELLERARHGNALAAFVSGAPGIGKTRLLRDFSRSAAAQRATVVSVSAPRATQRVPYGTAARLAERLASNRGALGVSAATASVLVGMHPALSAIYRSVGAAIVPPDHGTRLLALAELVCAIAHEALLLIVVDDAQWLDDASRELIFALPDLCPGAQMLLVLGARESGLPQPDRAISFELGPLTPDMTGSMIESLARLPDEPWAEDWVRTLHSAARGVPLGVLDVTRLALEREVVAIRQGCWECVDGPALLRLTDSAAPREARIAQLPDRARQLAVTLALAGGSLDLAVASVVMDCDDETAASAARVLVERGIGDDDGVALNLAHEEYAAAARSVANVDASLLLRVRIATELAGSDDVDTLRRAYAVAEDSEDAALAHHVATRYLAVMRRQTPRVTARAAMADLMGLGERATRLEELIDIHDRRRMWRRAAAAGAFVVVVAAGAGVALQMSGLPALPPDALLSVEIVNQATLSVAQDGISLRDWSVARPIRVDVSSASPVAPSRVMYRRRNPADTGAWVGVASRDDRLTDDIVIVRAGAAPVFVASAAGDDALPSWSPDGRRIAFVTARWSGDRGDLAIVDVATDSVTRVGGGPGMMAANAFRGDGRGIVFTRSNSAPALREVCTIPMGDRTPRCRKLDPQTEVASVAWPTPQTVYFAASEAGGRNVLSAWDLASDSVQVIATCLGASLTVDPMGMFLLCTDASAERRTYVAPIARPDQMRNVEIVGLPSGATATVSIVAHTASTNSDRRIKVAESNIVAGVPHVLQAASVTQDGQARGATDVRWRLLSGDAVLSDAGVLTASGPGDVSVIAFDGMATDTATLPVRENRDVTLLRESWSESWLDRWRVFGTPEPVVTTVDGERAFLNAGDGVYFSGAYSRVEWPSREGLAADFDLSTPVNADRWQLLRAGLRGGSDGSVLAGWDHRSGYAPAITTQEWCMFQFPAGASGTRGGMFGAVVETAAPTWMRDGERYRVRIQLFPDGRCGVAINGKAVGVSSVPGRDSTARIVIDGSSVGTSMLVHGVVLRRGVPSDIRWPSPTVPR